ncbi:MAG: molybdopterin molybdotransferase MoeA [Blautia sp.]|nr:molybdopterin molybdotransferase MoeA [Blautia sp.]
MVITNKSVEESQEYLLSCLQKQPVIIVPLDQAGGLVLAKDMISSMNLPPYPKSAMDGYAVRAEETLGADREHPVILDVQGELLAGEYKEYIFRPGTAVRVMTGAMVPDGYDAVIRQEDTDYGEDQVAIYTSIMSCNNYCRIGEDLKTGDMVLPKNTFLNPLAIASLAGVGVDRVPVYQPVRVAILATGSEVTNVGQKLAPGHIYNTNSPMLESAIRGHQGVEVVLSRVVPDEEKQLEDALRYAVDIADFVITTGGICVGKKDLLPLVLEKMEAEPVFRRADIQPGTPTMANMVKGKPVLSLSGNPFAALINFDLYFWPAVSYMTNCSDYQGEVCRAVFRGCYPQKNTHRRMIRAELRGNEVRIPVSVHSSSVIHNVTSCNCMIDLEPGRSLEDGEEVTVRIFNLRKC